MCALSIFHMNQNITERTSSILGCPCATSYVILDVETTGLNPNHDKIIQLSAIRYDCNGQPIRFFNTYVNPGISVPAKVSKIHGITDALLETAPSVDIVRDDFLRFVDGAPIFGYNVTFDLRFLDRECSGAFDGCSYIDVLQLARLFLNAPDYKLETVSTAIAFSPSGNYHDSFTDCEAVAAILNRIGEIDLEAFVSVFHCNTSCAKPHHQHHHYSARSVPVTLPSACDPRHPLFGKHIVFTGELSMDRSTAMQMAADVGAILKTGVSRKTDYLVVGQQDIALVGFDGMSGKEEKAYELNASGKASIQIIDEQQFLNLIEGNCIEDDPLDVVDTADPDAMERVFLQKIRDELSSAIEASGGDKNLLSINSTKSTTSQGSGYTAVKAGSFTVFRLKLRGKQHYISLPTVFSDLVPSEYPRKAIKSDAKYLRILIDDAHPIESYTDFLVLVAGETINRYPKEWDCCSLYMECSNAKKCIHADKAFALGCGYRKILNSGRIFYGKNRNID